MSLQNMGVLLRAARREKVALGAFECWDSLNIQGIARAAKTPDTICQRRRVCCTL